MKKIAVIGGGISGISTCYYLEKFIKKPIKITLFEKSDRAGGLASTYRKDGHIFEAGPDCFIVEKPLPLQIALELGFSDDVIGTLEENKGTYIYADGRLHLMPDGLMTLVPTKFLPFAATKLFTLKGKARMLLDLVIPAGKKEDETLAEFVRRRLGEEALSKLATPLVAGIYGSDPENMSLKATFPKFLEMEKKYRSLIIGFIAARRRARKQNKPTTDKHHSYFLSFKDGMGELSEKMLGSLKHTEVRTSTEVKSLKPEGSGFVVKTPRGEEYFDAVIIASKAYEAAEILPEDLNTLAYLLKSITYNSVATVNFVFDKNSFPVKLRGHGFVVEGKADLKISAATYITNKWPFRSKEGKHIIRVFVGGGKKSALAELSEEEIAKIALEDLFKALDTGLVEPEEIFVKRFIKGLPQYDLNHLDRTAKIKEELKKAKGIFLTGSYLRGIGIPDCIKLAQETAMKVAEFLDSAS